jgi:hypothetical protein
MQRSGGKKMPNVADALDVNRFREIAHESILACNLWLSLNLACERGDRPAAFHAAEQIRTLTTTTLRLVKALGTESVP